MFRSEEREAYRAKMAAQRRQWEARLEELKGKAEESAADMRLEFQRQYREARKQRDQARKSLRRVERQSGAVWTSTKSRFQSLADRLRETLSGD